MAKWTPCDDGECPFGANSCTGIYFCRDNCGLGVDEDSYPEEEFDEEPDDSMLEMGFDPYQGCYSDDC